MQPETSRIAHESVRAKKGDHYKWIRQALEAAGKPLTAGEIVRGINRPGMDKTAVSRRMKEMEGAGQVIRGSNRPCECGWCSSRQIEWWLKLEPGLLFDIKAIPAKCYYK